MKHEGVFQEDFWGKKFLPHRKREPCKEKTLSPKYTLFVGQEYLLSDEAAMLGAIAAILGHEDKMDRIILEANLESDIGEPPN